MSKDDKQARLAAALRENLKKRKAAARPGGEKDEGEKTRSTSGRQGN